MGQVATPKGSTIILNIYKNIKNAGCWKKCTMNCSVEQMVSRHRDREGYLCWGSNPVEDTLKTIEHHNLQAAAFESGLDIADV